MRFTADDKVDLSDLAPTNSVLKLYENLVKEEKIRSDPHQLAIISKLDRWQAGFLA
jgi:predicted ATPase